MGWTSHMLRADPTHGHSSQCPPCLHSLPSKGLSRELPESWDSIYRGIVESNICPSVPMTLRSPHGERMCISQTHMDLRVEEGASLTVTWGRKMRW